MQDTNDIIEQNIISPKKASGDAGSVEQYSLKEQIEAQRYLASKKAVSKGLGVKISKMIAGSG